MAVEMIGQYKVTPLKNGKYAVALTNGNMGAFVTDKGGLEELRAKYNREKDTVELSGKKSSKAKKIGKGIASAYITGLGQVIDGRVKDGFKDFGKEIALGAIGGATGMLGYMNFVKAVEKGAKPYGWYGVLAASAVLGVAVIANKIHSIKDAYKNG